MPRKKRMPSRESLTQSSDAAPLPADLNQTFNPDTKEKKRGLLYWIFVAPFKKAYRGIKSFFSFIGSFFSSLFRKADANTSSGQLNARIIDRPMSEVDTWIKPQGNGHIYDMTGSRPPSSRAAVAMYQLNDPITDSLGAGVQKDALRGHYFISESGASIQAPSVKFSGTRADVAAELKSGALELFLSDKGFQHHDPTSDLAEIKVQTNILSDAGESVKEISGMPVKSYVVEPFQLLDDGTVSCKYKTNITSIKDIQTRTEYVKYAGEKGLRLLTESEDKDDLLARGVIEPIMHIDAKMIVMDHTDDSVNQKPDYWAHARHLQFHVPTCSLVCPPEIEVTGLRLENVNASERLPTAPLPRLEDSSIIRFPKVKDAGVSAILEQRYKRGSRFKEGGLTSNVAFQEGALEGPLEFDADGYSAKMNVGYKKIGSRETTLIDSLDISIGSQHPPIAKDLMEAKYNLANLLLERQDLRFRFPSQKLFTQFVRPFANKALHETVLKALSNSLPENCGFIRSYDLFLNPVLNSEDKSLSLHRFARGQDYVYLSDPVVLENDGQMPILERLRMDVQSGQLDFLAQVGTGVTEIVCPIINLDQSITLTKLHIIKSEDGAYELRTMQEFQEIGLDGLAEKVNCMMNASGVKQDKSVRASRNQLAVETDQIGVSMLSMNSNISKTLALDDAIEECRARIAALKGRVSPRTAPAPKFK